jgi:phospholipid transport system substrate-binding protein
MILNSSKSCFRIYNPALGGVIVAFALLHASGTQAKTPTETVAYTIDSVVAMLQDTELSEETKKRHIKGIISEHFDFRAISSRVLATNWNKATKRQRAKFTNLFKELLSNTYWRKISGYKNEQVEYIGETLRNEKLATVNTLIKTETVATPVDYKLYRRDGEGWYVYDVVIEQVSLVRNYRGSFQQIVHDVGIDGLIQQLETKVARSSVPEDD